MKFPQKVLGHLGLNADHSGEVLQSVLELMISSMDPWKRCHCFGFCFTELQSQFIDTTIQRTTQELEKQIKCVNIYMHTPTQHNKGGYDI